MKHIVSVSIGSSDRNHKATINVLGEDVLLERIGTDGNIERAVELIRELDGKVDAFGMGGIDLYMAGAGKKFVFKDARHIAAAAQKTPLVDGTGLKSSLEYRVVKRVAEVEKLPIAGKNVFVVCAIDRIGMGIAFEELGCKVTYGDLMFAVGIPIPLHSVRSLYRLAPIVMPIITQIPFKWLYPTGKEQSGSAGPRKYQKYYDRADVIAGDFHYIRKYLPDRIDGKTVITNTVTSKDVDELGRRGASVLVTTTPEMQGRSFGTNVIEALLVTMINKPVSEIAEKDYFDMLDKLDIRPRVVRYGESR
ncbi:MAG: quinate 5-dehydrogenase [Clostridia bacterium]|nr:quinate 5-dehydrogenase [Clostridia bacterium]